MSPYPRVNNIVDCVGNERLRTVISENVNTPNICADLHWRSHDPNDDTDMVAIRVQVVASKRYNVTFLYDVPGAEPGAATFGASANLYLPRDSRIALSRSEKQCAPSAGSHDTIDAIAADA